MGRTIKYLSPSGISLYRKDPEAFYIRYLSDGPKIYEPQTQPMAVGSAFDAYAKSTIYEKLFGKNHDPKYSFDALFEAQVDQMWHDWARLHGLYVFDSYEKSGALSDLMLDLEQAVNVPRFEIEIMGVVHSAREPRTLITAGGLVLLGRPDVFYINKHGAHVILDWKVNGYLSKVPKSPMAGYVRLRADAKKSGHHPDCRITMFKGTIINGNGYLELFQEDWATQLSIYAWLAGLEVGDEYIAGIDQICCAPNGSDLPDLRIAEHRNRVTPRFQFDVYNRAMDLWERAHSDHFFREMPKVDSQARCKMLDQQAVDTANCTDELFLELTQARPKPY